MSTERHHVEEEMEDLRHDMESFKKEKERVRAIVGKIGGMPSVNTKLFNIIFLFLILICLVISLLSEGKLQLAMMELAIAALSAKIIYLMHNQSRVNHFQLWILSSLEWRLNEILKEVRGERNRRERLQKSRDVVPANRDSVLQSIWTVYPCVIRTSCS